MCFFVSVSGGEHSLYAPQVTGSSMSGMSGLGSDSRAAAAAAAASYSALGGGGSIMSPSYASAPLISSQVSHTTFTLIKI
jgi:hypothetical protein